VGFFAEFSAWLNGLLATYVSEQTARVAAAIEPALVVLAGVYVMGWGILQAAGQIDEPLIEGLKRIARVALVLGVGLHLWLYQDVIVDLFFVAPSALAAAMIGAPDSVTIVDQVLFQGGDAAAALIQKGGVFDGNLTYALAGFVVYALIGLASIYTIFLLSLAKVALSILLALGPLYIATLLFDASHRFFQAWVAQLANFAMIAVLVTLVVGLFMHLLTTVTAQAASQGTGIDIAEGARVCFAAGLIFLLLRQVMPIASGLASGVALNTHNVVSRGLQWVSDTHGRWMAKQRAIELDHS
jgi:type IV secretion system protein VirB6